MDGCGDGGLCSLCFLLNLPTHEIEDEDEDENEDECNPTGLKPL